MISEVVPHIDEDQIQRLDEIMAQWNALIGSDERFSDLDENFHKTLYRDLENRTLLELISVFWQAFSSIYDQLPEVPDVAREYESHLKILEAVKAGEVRRSRKALIASFDNVTRQVDALNPEFDRAAPLGG